MVVAFALVGTGTNVARADSSSGDFLKDYDAAGQADRRIYDMFVTGFESGLFWANAIMVNQRHEEPLYCQPPHLTVPNSLMIDMLRRGIRQDPAIGRAELAIGFLAVLQRAFPCPQKAK
jgi:hypothetical protein